MFALKMIVFAFGILNFALSVHGVWNGHWWFPMGLLMAGISFFALIFVNLSETQSKAMQSAP